MKKIVILLILVGLGWQAGAQNRKHISNFAAIPQYYNPALTGYQGSLLKSVYRDQWGGGYKGAPRTFFLSGEVNLADISGNTGPGVRHGFGLSLLHDVFGPTKESQLFLNYSSGLQLNETWQLRGGVGISYGAVSLDISQVSLDDSSDPEYQYLYNNNNRLNKLDANLGIVLATDNFFVGYGVQDLVRGKVNLGEAYLQDMYPLQQVVQAGFRKNLGDQFGLVLNGIYRYDQVLKSTVEGQLKAVFNNMFWAGGGYRHDLAYSFNAGVRLKQFMLGCTLENSTSQAKSIIGSTNEIMLTYNLFGRSAPATNTLSVW